ncbi:MAG TPA: hypothetical protein VIL85_19525 [Thermomicrobiales bacterium]|jgi:hypothetical protein
MSAPSLLGLLLAIAAVSFVVAPLLWPRAFGIGVPVAASAASPLDEVETLALLRDDLLAQIVDLDFEQAVGKTDEEEYQEERAALKRRALAVIRSLDERLQAEAIEESIEREVTRARTRRAEVEPLAEASDLNDEVERQILALRRARGAGVARVE